MAPAGWCVFFFLFASTIHAKEIICLPVSVTTRNAYAKKKMASKSFPLHSFFLSLFFRDWFHLNETTLYQVFFPSLSQSQTAEFDFLVYLGYDAKDPLFDRENAEAEFLNLVAPYLPSGFTLKLFKYDDTANCNVLAVNYLTEECFLDGADYFYRVNDDTRFLDSTWAAQLVNLMKKQHNFGVVGPVDPKMPRIFTHSMVSRTHLEVFEMRHFHYQFCNFWSDDYISALYQPPYVTVVDKPLIAHAWQEKRYTVDENVLLHLNGTLAEGKEKIQKYLTQYGMKRETDFAVEETDIDLTKCPFDGPLDSRKVVACIRRAHQCLETPKGRGADCPFSYLDLWKRSPTELAEIYNAVDWEAVSAKVEESRKDPAESSLTAVPLERNLNKIFCSIPVKEQNFPVFMPREWFKFGDWKLNHCLAPRGTCGCQRDWNEEYCVADFFFGWGLGDFLRLFGRCDMEKTMGMIFYLVSYLLFCQGISIFKRRHKLQEFRISLFVSYSALIAIDLFSSSVLRRISCPSKHSSPLGP
jgi:hypothetical protein